MHSRSWAARAATLLSSLLLAACGGGTEPSPGGAGVSSARSLQVEARVQPDTTVQDVPRVKARAASAAPVARRIVLGPLPDQGAKSAAGPGQPLQVGVSRTVAETATVDATAAQLRWQDTAAGGRIAALTFEASGAKGLRLGILVEQLPGGAVLRFYSPARPGTVFQIAGQEVLQLLDRNRSGGETGAAARTYWSPEFGSEAVTMEVELPAPWREDSVRISVPQISHIFAALEIPPGDEAYAKGINDSESCNQDATCNDSFSTERNAVARMVFTDGGGTYVCTGTLLNDRPSSGTPYFISARHCISTQAAASSLQTDWFFRSNGCNTRQLRGQSSTRYNGATLLYSGAATDTTLLQLADTPPAGATFAGWDASTPPASRAVATLHHPSGDLLKISLGATQGYATCSSFDANSQFTCSNTGSEGSFLRVVWTSGTTEGGSSGSGLFKADGSARYLVGTLRGGSASCRSQSASDYYGRFDLAFQNALKQWLDPANSLAVTGPGPNGRIPIYRFYNGRTGAHFFTASASERDFVVYNDVNFNYEGTAFYAYAGSQNGRDAVWRFYNRTTGAHFYTINTSERDLVQQNAAFSFEGPSWYAQTSGNNSATPVYRFYKTTRGTHFYTVSAEERDFIQQFNREFQYEGVGYFAWTSG